MKNGCAENHFDLDSAKNKNKVSPNNKKLNKVYLLFCLFPFNTQKLLYYILTLTKLPFSAYKIKMFVYNSKSNLLSRQIMRHEIHRGYNVYRLCIFFIDVSTYTCMFDVNDVNWLYFIVKAVSNST